MGPAPRQRDVLPLPLSVAPVPDRSIVLSRGIRRRTIHRNHLLCWKNDAITSLKPWGVTEHQHPIILGVYRLGACLLLRKSRKP